MSNTYLSNAELKATFADDETVAQLTDTPETGIPDEDVLTEIIDGVESLINSYFAKRYLIDATSGIVTTEAQLDNRLRACARKMSKVELLRRGEHVSETQERNYEQEIEWLKGISDGTLAVPAEAALSTTVAIGVLSAFGRGNSTEFGAREFTRDNLAAM